MNTSKSRPLAKVFWPVMLLTAALSLPVDTQAAPSQKARHEHSDRADRAQGRKQDNKKQEAKAHQDRGRHQGEEQRVQAQQRAELQRQQVAAQRRQAELQRKSQLQRQAQLQQQRKLELQRQANLQRQAELQRRAELQRKAELQRRYDSQRTVTRYAVPRNRVGYINGNAGRYRYYDRNNGRYYESRYGRGDTLVVDGYLTREGYECQALRDDNGELYMLVGNTFGLRNGDHARVTGRVVDGGYCNWEGTAFEITDVKALWADRRHQAVYYHHSYDGESFGDRDNWFGRRPRTFYNRIER
jgi:flagellar motor protein MotB